MSNIIYSSYGWGTGKEGHGHFEGREWTNIQREKINEYCNNHNINLKVIGHDHKWMSEILSKIEPNRDIHSKSHSVYTLSAIAALLDFCETDHDLFYWLHLDMAISNMDINVFDTFEIKDDHFYCWELEDFHLDIEWDRIKLNMLDSLLRASDFNVDTISKHKKCNASVFIANKQSALNFRDALNMLDFINKPADPAIGFIEETIVEAVSYIDDSLIVKDSASFNNGTIKPIWFCTEEGIEDPIGAYNDCVFVHFWGQHKNLIEEFYEGRK